ncbi:MAG TPA: acyl-CoA dehydrogenase family protein [Acidimicrobiales bacterium]|nr:acyl-CoA dehydrogenase family protein [Acidimicrobiales bacterium]
MRWTIEDSPTRAAFRAQFRQWLADVLEPGWMEAIEGGDEEGYAKVRAAAERNGWNVLSWMRTIGESGYGAPLWPEEYGGVSGEPWMQQLVREELSRWRLPLFGPNILGVGLAGPTIIAHGTDDQKSRFLRRILTGEDLWCQLFSEPGSGSDLASLATRAVHDGDEWVINGQKVWTSIAQFSRYGMLLTRTDPDAPKHDGLTYFILEMSTPGVDVRPLRQMTGSSEFNEVYFTDVRIPDARRVGDVNDGWRCARTTLANERDTIAGVSLDPTALFGGVAKDPWQAFLDHVRDRDDPAVRQRLAQLYIEKEVRDITVFRANSARLRGQQPGPEGSVNKLFNAELNQRRTDFAVTASGMAGVAWMPRDKTAELRSHGLLRARANTIEGGTSEVLRNQVAERVLGLPRDDNAERDLPWRELRRN